MSRARSVAWGAALSLAVLSAASTGRSHAAAPADRTIVVLLFEGWSPASNEPQAPPTLAQLQREGAWTHHLLPPFPSTRLVSQVTLSTGCWPEHHGVVSDVFIDPQRGRYDQSGDAAWLTGCEHLQRVAARQGVRVATLGWVGEESVPTDGTEPADAARAREVIRTLQLPEPDRPRLILAHFAGPLAVARAMGPDSPEARAAVASSDAAVGEVLAAIQTLPFRDRLVLLVASDHGMLPAWIGLNLARILHHSGLHPSIAASETTAFLYFADPAELHQALTTLTRYQSRFRLASRDDMPADWHLGHSPRVGDVILSAYPPYVMEDLERAPFWLRWLGHWGPELLATRRFVKGTSGYEPSTPGMAGLLYAWGAGIARGREIPNLRTVDVHPTVCRLLGIDTGAPVDGAVMTPLLAAED